jgi:hypothetical protein
MKRGLALCLLVLAPVGDVQADAWVGASEVTGLAITPNGRTLLVAAMDGRLRLLDLDTRRQRTAVLAHKGGVWALGLSGDGRHFITGGADRLVRVWELPRVKEVQTYEGHTTPVSAVALSGDGRLAASGDYTGAVHLWEIATARVRLRHEVNNYRVTGLAFSPDGKWLAGGGVQDAAIPGIGGPNTASRLCLWQLADSAREVLAETGETIRFLPGRGGLVASGTRSEMVRGNSFGGVSQTILWDPWRRRRLFAVKNHYHGLAISADGRYVATSWGSRRFYDNTLMQDSPARGIHLWELASGKDVWSAAVKKADAGVMVMTPDGRTLIAGSRRGHVYWHDLRPEGWPPPRQWGEADFARAWKMLGGTGKGYTVVWDLVACGDDAVRWLRKTWKPVSAQQRATRLVADLDSDDFAVRDRARQELEELAEEAEPVLRASLEKPASAEVKRVVRRLLTRLEGPASPTRLRHLRVLTVLERIGTAEARRLLRELGKGPAGPYLREQARLAERRLAARASR